MGTIHGQLPECPKYQGPIDVKKSTTVPSQIRRDLEAEIKNGNCTVTHKSNIFKNLTSWQIIIQ